MSSRLRSRPGLEVYLNKGGNISISQEDDLLEHAEGIVQVHPEDVPRLIKMLEAEVEAWRSIPAEEREKAELATDAD